MAAMAEEAQREAIILDVDDDDLSSRFKVFQLFPNQLRLCGPLQRIPRDQSGSLEALLQSGSTVASLVTSDLILLVFHLTRIV